MEKKKEVKKPANDGLAAEVRRQGDRIEKIKYFLERMFNYDVDGDGKIGDEPAAGRSKFAALCAIAVLGIVCLIARAAEDVQVRYLATEGRDAVITLEADDGDDDADELQIIMKASGSGAISIGGVEVLALGDSTQGTAGTGVTESTILGAVNKTVLTLDDVAVPVTDLTGTTNSCGGVKVYDFPEGEIYILGFMVNDLTISSNAVIDEDHGGDFAFGTTVGTGPDLTSTEIDMTDAKVSIDPITNLVDAVTELDNIAESRFDGTATAKDLYLNLLFDGGDIDANTTNTVDATVTIHWINLGDD